MALYIIKVRSLFLNNINKNLFKNSIYILYIDIKVSLKPGNELYNYLIIKT